MGKVKLPGGSLLRRDGYGDVVLLPDGTIARSKSHGSGNNYGYIWGKTEEKVDLNSPDFDWWNWMVLTGTKLTVETAIFGCRNGKADELCH